MLYVRTINGCVGWGPVPPINNLTNRTLFRTNGPPKPPLPLSCPMLRFTTLLGGAPKPHGLLPPAGLNTNQLGAVHNTI